MRRTHFPRLLLLCAFLALLSGPFISSANAVLAADAGHDSASSTALPASVTAAPDDFIIVVSGVVPDGQKYLTFGWNGWSGNTLRWRYNDNNRPASMAVNADGAVARIQAAMAKWSAVCNVRFVYDGITASAPSLPNGSRDGINVIAWGVLTGNTTGVTYTGASGFSNSTLTIDESDMVINYQFNPNFDATLVHEVGHMIGLKHSNQEGTVMSGPNTSPDPSTSYTGFVTLQPDDVAGCRALYGASANSAPAPVASASALSFAATTVGAVSGNQSVVLTNNGTAPLVITSTIVSGADFSLLSTSCGALVSVAPGASCSATVRFAPAGAGLRSGTLTIQHNASPATTVVSLSGTGVSAATGKREMIEYRYAPLDYYFITSRDSDKASLDATVGWARTGASFFVFATQQTGTRGVTRFYFDRVALNGARGSHFYTLLDSDLLALANQNPTQSTAPGFAQNEGIDSFAYPPVVAGPGGFCSAGQLPVYRLFRGASRFPDDPNHRFTISATTYNTFVAQGWDGEGVTFCVPAN